MHLGQKSDYGKDLLHLIHKAPFCKGDSLGKQDKIYIYIYFLHLPPNTSPTGDKHTFGFLQLTCCRSVR